VRSQEAVTIRAPSGLKAAKYSEPSWPRNTVTGLPSAFQTRAVRSSATVTTRAPSGLTAPCRTLPLCPRSETRAPPSTPSRVAVSVDEVSALRPSAATATNSGRPVSLRSTVRSSFGSTRQKRSLPSRAPVKMRWPSRVGARQDLVAVVGEGDDEAPVTARHVPDAGAAIGSRR
jgi:hypothetical protein